MPLANEQPPMPDYERPPVVETVLGIQFEPIANFGNAQLGAFWKSLDATEWVSVADAPPMPAQLEQFGDAVRLPTQFRIRFGQELRTRLQIKNRAGDRMVQVQHGRLHFNWLNEGHASYPRYGRIRDGFNDVLQRFMAFIGRERLGEFRPNQWEVTYRNSIPKGTVWNSPSDWGFFKPLGPVPTLPGLLEGESFSGEWHFVIPDRRGRLHILWQHGLIPVQDNELEATVSLTLTARGPLVEGVDRLAAVDDGLELGHKTIVRSFRELMSDQANAYWGLKT